jgi:hypothetical protein
MFERRTFTLYEPVQAHKALMALWPTIKSLLFAGHRLVLTLAPATRSSEQNRKLHAIIADVARQATWAGAKQDAETWKRLFVSAWCRATGESVTILPALDGHGVDLVPRRTSKLTKAECCELIEYITAWAVEHGVELDEFWPEELAHE